MRRTLDDIETIEITRADLANAFAKVTGSIVSEFAERVDCDDEEGNALIDQFCNMFGKAGAELLMELFDKEGF